MTYYVSTDDLMVLESSSLETMESIITGKFDNCNFSYAAIALSILYFFTLAQASRYFISVIASYEPNDRKNIQRVFLAVLLLSCALRVTFFLGWLFDVDDCAPKIIERNQKWVHYLSNVPGTIYLSAYSLLVYRFSELFHRKLHRSFAHNIVMKLVLSLVAFLNIAMYGLFIASSILSFKKSGNTTAQRAYITLLSISACVIASLFLIYGTLLFWKVEQTLRTENSNDDEYDNPTLEYPDDYNSCDINEMNENNNVLEYQPPTFGMSDSPMSYMYPSADGQVYEQCTSNTHRGFVSTSSDSRFHGRSIVNLSRMSSTPSDLHGHNQTGTNYSGRNSTTRHVSKNHTASLLTPALGQNQAHSSRANNSSSVTLSSPACASQSSTTASTSHRGAMVHSSSSFSAVSATSSVGYADSVSSADSGNGVTNRVSTTSLTGTMVNYPCGVVSTTSNCQVEPLGDDMIRSGTTVSRSTSSLASVTASTIPCDLSTGVASGAVNYISDISCNEVALDLGSTSTHGVTAGTGISTPYNGFTTASMIAPASSLHSGDFLPLSSSNQRLVDSAARPGTIQSTNATGDAESQDSLCSVDSLAVSNTHSNAHTMSGLSAISSISAASGESGSQISTMSALGSALKSNNSLSNTTVISSSGSLSTHPNHTQHLGEMSHQTNALTGGLLVQQITEQEHGQIGIRGLAAPILTGNESPLVGTPRSMKTGKYSATMGSQTLSSVVPPLGTLPLPLRTPKASSKQRRDNYVGGVKTLGRIHNTNTLSKQQMLAPPASSTHVDASIGTNTRSVSFVTGDTRDNASYEAKKTLGLERDSNNSSSVDTSSTPSVLSFGSDYDQRNSSLGYTAEGECDTHSASSGSSRATTFSTSGLLSSQMSVGFHTRDASEASVSQLKYSNSTSPASSHVHANMTPTTVSGVSNSSGRRPHTPSGISRKKSRHQSQRSVVGTISTSRSQRSHTRQNSVAVRYSNQSGNNLNQGSHHDQQRPEGDFRNLMDESLYTVEQLQNMTLDSDLSPMMEIMETPVQVPKRANPLFKLFLISLTCGACMLLRSVLLIILSSCYQDKDQGAELTVVYFCLSEVVPALLMLLIFNMPSSVVANDFKDQHDVYLHHDQGIMDFEHEYDPEYDHIQQQQPLQFDESNGEDRKNSNERNAHYQIQVNSSNRDSSQTTRAKENRRMHTEKLGRDDSLLSVNGDQHQHSNFYQSDKYYKMEQ